ncbi:type II toxin-antitoxin system RelE/ParE family toxin [Hansschlegelia zhihuaiae]|uniref:Type II toxin-antitoxin system RelE/ParE family toxin n=1 Tax=Hansschlegelia zhihuaiae TaxID=405005 RepID=A0A4V1KI65_9HYPH|nr:type II toxin-antitoxin system RelE/ParE family toxin [Hansschlegelia zhihuaiae]RXF69612.1 type II toxin-antitoxin system RelE/ParE family toxin [Hansschlegelia zhihuaiae]
MIVSFRDRMTAAVSQGKCPKGFPTDIFRAAFRKLTMLNSAATLEDLASPPGNRLEALKGDRAGQYSIRINDQFRICFIWSAAGPTDVEVVDYH